MFLLGPSAGLLPYLLAILVSLVYFIEGGTSSTASVIPLPIIEQSIETNIIHAERISSLFNKEETEPKLFFVVPISCGHGINPFKVPPSLLLSNGPLRAPPLFLD